MQPNRIGHAFAKPPVTFSEIRKQQYLIDHTAFIYLMNRAGKYVAFFPPGTSPERMATMVREELSQTRP